MAGENLDYGDMDVAAVLQRSAGAVLHAGIERIESLIAEPEKAATSKDRARSIH